MNRLIITGNLTKDPELRVTPQGISVCSFTVAVNRRTNDTKQVPDFFRVTTWRELAESCGKYLSRGKKVAVLGAVSLSTFTKQDGTQGASIVVQANEVEFLSPRDEGTKQESNPQEVPHTVPADDEDLPF